MWSLEMVSNRGMYYLGWGLKIRCNKTWSKSTKKPPFLSFLVIILQRLYVFISSYVNICKILWRPKLTLRKMKYLWHKTQYYPIEKYLWGFNFLIHWEHTFKNINVDFCVFLSCNFYMVYALISNLSRSKHQWKSNFTCRHSSKRLWSVGLWRTSCAVGLMEASLKKKFNKTNLNKPTCQEFKTKNPFYNNYSST